MSKLILYHSCDYCQKDFEDGDEYIVYNGNSYCDEECMVKDLEEMDLIETRVFEESDE